MFTKKRKRRMFDLNPLAQPNAWWQHVVMLLGAGLLGYIIGYRRNRGVKARLESDLTSLTNDLENCRNAVADAAQQMGDVSAAPVPLAAATSEKRDNLKKIEGIGPKIEQLLNQEGIVSFRQLSQADPETLSSILKAAGPRFQMHDPGTWPQQAALAAEAKWDELSALQSELDKGRVAD
jgi:predicted flap endonuclease-1-like 5' DNA nuclease